MADALLVVARLGWLLRQESAGRPRTARGVERHAVATARRELRRRHDAGELTADEYELRLLLLRQDAVL